MIEILEYHNLYFVGGNSTIKFTCPYCNNDITFVRNTGNYPGECRFCASALPRIDILVVNLRRRLNWHATPGVGFQRDILLKGNKTFIDNFKDGRGID
jgi:hypothetical protein